MKMEIYPGVEITAFAGYAQKIYFDSYSDNQ